MINSNNYAGFFKRLVAALIDATILLILGFLANHVLPVGGGIIIVFLYYPFLEASEVQATVGKYAMGIQVISEDGSRLSLRSSMIRTFFKLISSSLFFLGHLFYFLDQKRQALHDLLAHSLVIYGKNEKSSLIDAWIKEIRCLFDSKLSCKSRNDSLYFELEKLHELRERGVLTEEEFNHEKQKILGR